MVSVKNFHHPGDLDPYPVTSNSADYTLVREEPVNLCRVNLHAQCTCRCRQTARRGELPLLAKDPASGGLCGHPSRSETEMCGGVPNGTLW